MARRPNKSPSNRKKICFVETTGKTITNFTTQNHDHKSKWPLRVHVGMKNYKPENYAPRHVP